MVFIEGVKRSTLCFLGRDRLSTLHFHILPRYEQTLCAYALKIFCINTEVLKLMQTHTVCMQV